MNIKKVTGVKNRINNFFINNCGYPMFEDGKQPVDIVHLWIFGLGLYGIGSLLF